MPPKDPTNGTSSPSAGPEHQIANSLGAALLLAFSGGNLDAFLYLEHGKVFAGAMTGNAILCGIALLTRRRHEIVHHALPVAAFLAGVWIAEILQTRVRHHAVTIALALEAAGLFIASFLPGTFPDAFFIVLIALLAAFQIASFHTADTFSYSSTFITGDLRTFAVGLYKTLRPETRAEGAREARDLFSIVVSFVLGSLASAFLAPRCGNHELWLPAATVGVVFALALRGSLRRGDKAAAAST